MNAPSVPDLQATRPPMLESYSGPSSEVSAGLDPTVAASASREASSG